MAWAPPIAPKHSTTSAGKISKMPVSPTASFGTRLSRQSIRGMTFRASEFTALLPAGRTPLPPFSSIPNFTRPLSPTAGATIIAWTRHPGTSSGWAILSVPSTPNPRISTMLACFKVTSCSLLAKWMKTSHLKPRFVLLMLLFGPGKTSISWWSPTAAMAPAVAMAAVGDHQEIEVFPGPNKSISKTKRGFRWDVFIHFANNEHEVTLKQAGVVDIRGFGVLGPDRIAHPLLVPGCLVHAIIDHAGLLQG